MMKTFRAAAVLGLLALILLTANARAQQVMYPCVGTSFTVPMTGSAVKINSYPRRAFIVVMQGGTSAPRGDLGFDSGITINNGIPLFPGGGGYENFVNPPTSDLWVIAPNGSSVFCAQG